MIYMEETQSKKDSENLPMPEENRGGKKMMKRISDRILGIGNFVEMDRRGW